MLHLKLITNSETFFMTMVLSLKRVYQFVNVICTTFTAVFNYFNKYFFLNNGKNTKYKQVFYTIYRLCMS
jgi:hypothetical protein